jgi:hypothetical protein
MTNLKINKDYKYSYPYGAIEGPVLYVKKGDYAGLALHIESSYIESSVDILGVEKNDLHYAYNIRKMWTSAIVNPDKPTSISLNSGDQQFIYELVYSFIKETN